MHLQLPDSVALRPPVQGRTGVEYAHSGPRSEKTGERLLDRAFMTTSLDLPGFRITRSLGVVRGIVVRSRSVVGTIGAGIQSLFGGNITLWTQMCEIARQEAFELMARHAEQMGANAVIAFRYDANEISAGVTEVLAYGTAVVVEPDK